MVIKKIGDNTLEETTTYVRLISKEDLLREKEHLENDIAHYQKELDEINNRLDLLLGK